MSKKFNYTPLQKVLSGSTLFYVIADHQIFFLIFSCRHYSHCICFPTFLKADTLCTGLTSTAYYREYENLSEHRSADIPAQSGTYCGVWSNWPNWQSISTLGQAGWLLVLLVNLAEYYYFWSSWPSITTFGQFKLSLENCAGLSPQIGSESADSQSMINVECKSPLSEYGIFCSTCY